MTEKITTPQQSARVVAANRRLYWVTRHWMLVFSVGYGLFVGVPFLAPVFMQLGWDGAGRGVYALYSFLCHQMPQRSLFLFGPKAMYSLASIQEVWQNTINPLVLRQFIGAADMGWKVAWSDRMISMYASILVFAWLWHPLRKRIRPLSWWGLVLFLIPMGVDGLTHMVSDLIGIGQGFRYTNTWLAALTNNAFFANFYAGDALGSFNSIMRWLSGILFGMGFVWFGFPYLESYFSSIAATIEAKFKRAGIEL